MAQFNSETNGNDLYSDARNLCGIDETSDTTTLTTKQFARSANFALDRINALILKADGFTFDDTNQSGELIDTSVTFSTGATKISVQATWLKTGRVRITDSAGNYVTLVDITRKMENDSQLNATAGTPSSFYRLGNYIYFDKPTSYSGTAQVQFQRGASYFVYSDTTKTPGFAPQFHRLISLWGALDYCEMNYLQDRAAAIKNRIGSPPDRENGQPGSGMEKELMDFYAARDTDMKVSLLPQREDYGQSGLNRGSGSYPQGNNPYGF